MEYKFNIPSKQEFIEMAKKAEIKKTLLGLPIDRADVEKGDIRQVTKFFENIVASKSVFKNSVMLSISGYDFDTRELFEIDEVRQFITKLINRVPYLFYYVHLEECFPWMMGCYSDSVTTARPFNQKPMNAVEASHRRFNLGQDITMPLKLSLTSSKVKALTNSLKVLGNKVNDIDYANEVIDTIHNTLIK
ncbi:hypothetical protein ACIQ1D_19240 [Lysinibacillus xylanilyticus]|uniref:hypothetical protein n=1 Tax=Lysinibacillus xylanilyticus TaxID=582475 RepID=UPI003818C4F0